MCAAARLLKLKTKVGGSTVAGAKSQQTVPDLCVVLWGLPMQCLCCNRGTDYLPGCTGLEVKDEAAEAPQAGVAGQLE